MKNWKIRFRENKCKLKNLSRPNTDKKIEGEIYSSKFLNSIKL